MTFDQRTESILLKYSYLSLLSYRWDTIGNGGEAWGTIGNEGEAWGTIGNGGEAWGTIGNEGEA